MPNRQRFRPAREDIIIRSRKVRNLNFPVTDDDYGILLMFREYEYRRSDQRGFSQLDGSGTSSSNVTDTIFLPLPANIADTFQVRVQRFDQGTTGDLVSSALSQLDIDNLGLGNLSGAIGRGVLGNLPSIQGETLSEIGDNISRDLGFLVRRGTDAVFPNQGRNIDAGTGTFVNPKAALSFEGVEMKIHSFDWSLSPRNDKESQNLRLISETIKRNILPQYVNTSVIQRAMFKYPAMVDVFFVGIDSEHYYYFKTCMVQTFNINYTPNGNAILRDGRPAAVQMQLQLIETDIHTAEDYGASSIQSSLGIDLEGTE
jgi:hypothetical protein